MTTSEEPSAVALTIAIIAATALAPIAAHAHVLRAALPTTG